MLFPAWPVVSEFIYPCTSDSFYFISFFHYVILFYSMSNCQAFQPVFAPFVVKSLQESLDCWYTNLPVAHLEFFIALINLLNICQHSIFVWFHLFEMSINFLIFAIVIWGYSCKHQSSSSLSERKEKLFFQNKANPLKLIILINNGIRNMLTKSE